MEIDFDKFFKKSELVPAIVQEKSTGEVLMLAYMNRESIQKTFGTRVQQAVICKRLSTYTPIATMIRFL